ncbi:AAA family ATPase [Actinoplanes sp. NPDC004185]
MGQLDGLRQRLRAAYVDRDEVIELLILAVVCGEHLLLLGPSGAAKTDLVTRFTELVGAKKFSYLLHRFTEPAELFGPVDIELLSQGQYRVRTEDRLPEAEIAFLDEIFHAGSAVLNTLLTIVNERVFHNGPGDPRVPLVSLIGAANDLPEDPSLAPIADRFLLRVAVEPVADADIPDLLRLGWNDPWRKDARVPEQPITTIKELAQLNEAVFQVGIPGPVLEAYVGVIRDLRRAGLRLSDRRSVRAQKMMAGAALLRGDNKVRLRDFWPLNHIWSARADRPLVQGLVQPLVESDGGAPTGARRGPDDVLAEARAEAGDELDPDPGDIVVGARLQHLGRLLRELRSLGDERALAELESIINRMLAGNPSQEEF